MSAEEFVRQYLEGTQKLTDAYGYTHVAQEGGFLLDNYPHVTSWLSRVAAQPGYISMDHKN